MSLVAAHLGIGNNSFLLLDDEQNLSLLNYPYSYDPINFSHFCGPQQFYFELLTRICADHSINISETRLLLVSSLPKDYFSSLKIDSYCHSKDLDLQRENISVRYLKRTLDNESFFKETADLPRDTSMEVLSNMYLYDNIIPSSLEDNVVWGHKILTTQHFPAKKKDKADNILFTGPPLTGSLLSRFFKYSLAFSLISEIGSYRVSFDDRDLHYIVSLIRQFDPETYKSLSPRISFDHIGYLAKCRGKVECLIKKEYGDQSFFEIAEEDLFVFPLLEGERARVYIKGRSCRPQEIDVEGGDLGFVVDTRTADFWQVRREGLLEKYSNWMQRLLTHKEESLSSMGQAEGEVL